jgi:hypothetical protein
VAALNPEKNLVQSYRGHRDVLGSAYQLQESMGLQFSLQAIRVAGMVAHVKARYHVLGLIGSQHNLGRPQEADVALDDATAENETPASGKRKVHFEIDRDSL